MSVAPAPFGHPQPMWDCILAWPSTRHGVRAAVLSAAAVGLFVLNGIVAAAGAYDWSQAARIAVLGPIAGGALLASLASAVLALLALRRGDRSIVLLWPLFLGAATAMFIIGEFGFPH